MSGFVSSPTALHPALSNPNPLPPPAPLSLQQHQPSALPSSSPSSDPHGVKTSLSDRPKSSSASVSTTTVHDRPLSSSASTSNSVSHLHSHTHSHSLSLHRNAAGPVAEEEPYAGAQAGFPATAAATQNPSSSIRRSSLSITSTAAYPELLPPPLSKSTNANASAAAHPPKGHRRAPSHEVPRQTIMKALASVVRRNKPEALSLTGMLSQQGGCDNRPATSSSQKLADALNELANRSMTPTTALPSLQSPCFYHNRFDDAVNIDKVLEEIKNDDCMSHSRLVQTATGVREVSKQLQRRPIKRAVRNVMIVTKARDNQLVYLTRELATWLLRTPRYGADVGVNVYVDAKLRNSRRFDANGIVAENPAYQDMLKYWTPDLCWSQPEKFDLVLTLGGDGTVLFTSWLFQRIVPPVLSFSLGSLGFLTSFEFEKYTQHLDRIMGDEGMRVNLRMRFTCTVYRDGTLGQEAEEGEQFEVLNELVIDRGPSPYVSNLELYGDDELLTVVQADGCIFSTPTGSTAYSLSAGGSLVHPDIPAILLTPICPHTLSFRPMVLSDTMLLRVSVPRNSRATAYCAFDGKGRVELKQGDYVTITASQYPFPTVVRTQTEWFDSVSRTLRWNTRAATQKGFDPSAGGSLCPSEDGKDEDPEWDIDTDSACYASEDGSISASPLRRQMSLLGM
ncbi:ATP-NAD kinase [Colletotrichum costaricense]|uniref:ATP-NAD kinase n=2 Tax=Colletotrichum acutatum species complex TaxID=2707335 RepID=A0AAI9YX63_9PEZI|nr:ATP-NAD kinase [Colletotrichum costaricense]XP_060384675.1 ATP-NAD kinase [Colletotrichum tamarilloi]KAI3551521.1 ATP-NAD kinase [Colletotrichum filicis]KAK1503379.1 ATP-NAD kinase [Colletotrichum tamarilloi]KAK1527502.1 ATP-NAD kinase [Colletotrichum costaricense]